MHWPVAVDTAALVASKLQTAAPTARSRNRYSFTTLAVLACRNADQSMRICAINIAKRTSIEVDATLNHTSRQSTKSFDAGAYPN